MQILSFWRYYRTHCVKPRAPTRVSNRAISTGGPILSYGRGPIGPPYGRGPIGLKWGECFKLFYWLKLMRMKHALIFLGVQNFAILHIFRFFAKTNYTCNTKPKYGFRFLGVFWCKIFVFCKTKHKWNIKTSAFAKISKSRNRERKELRGTLTNSVRRT